MRFQSDVFQEQRTTLRTNVVNKQHLLLFALNHAFTSRVSMSVNVPFVDASWSIPSPISPVPGPLTSLLAEADPFTLDGSKNAATLRESRRKQYCVAFAHVCQDSRAPTAHANTAAHRPYLHTM